MLLPHHRRILSLFLLLGVTACTGSDDAVIDPTTGMTRGDFRGLRERHAETQLPVPPIPKMSMPAAAPLRGSQAPMSDQLVSVSVTEQTPLRDTLFDLAKKANKNLELDPRIQGGIIFNATDQPFDMVLERICSLAGLRARTDGSFIRIELDEPFRKTYHLDYPSLARKTDSSVSIATNVFDADVTGNDSQQNRSQEGDNNSLARVTSVAEADFWKEVEQGLDSILANASAKALTTAENKEQAEAKANVNRQAGIISVFGTERQHRMIAEWLGQIERRTNTQVLIEARIVEVELSENHRSGINWRTLFNEGADVAARFGTVAAGGPFNTAATATDGVFTASLDGADMAAIVNMVREFGSTRILSSPRLTVLNNQTAILKVARNEVYFTTSAQFPTAVTSGGITVAGTPVFTSTPRTVPVGLVMTVQPAVGENAKDITLTLRPTISRIVARVQDPSIGLNAAQQNTTATVQSLVPVLAVREMDSVLRMRSGEVAVMGGLMQDSSSGSDEGIPGLDEMPVLGELAKARDDAATLTELVILLRATVVPSAPAPHIADHQLYDFYGRDPRPLMPPLEPQTIATTEE